MLFGQADIKSEDTNTDLGQMDMHFGHFEMGKR